MLEAIRLLSLILFILMAYLFVSVWFRRSSVVPELLRSGFGFRAFLTGSSLRDDASSSIRKRKGLVVTEHKDGLEVTETITVSSGHL